MKVFVLMTQWKEGDPEVSGIFSSFDKAVAYFVRMEFKDATMSLAEMQSKVAQVALKMAHQTDDEDYADFGNTRAWVEEHEVDEHSEGYET
jgi:hypothetical protein